jgi:predicted transposase/invertase (TIGR01784 family)
MKEILNPKVDLAFKKLFGSEDNKDILISFINSIVSEKDKVKEIRLVNPYNEKEFKNDKLSILDIKAQEELTGQWYNIEMQITDQDYYDKRALYYWSRLYTSQMSTGVNYDKLEKTICINILNFECIEDEKDYHNVYQVLNKESKKQFLDHLEIHFIELKKYHHELKTLLDKWILFLNEANLLEELPKELKEIPTIEKALNVLEAMSLNPSERESYEARLKWLRDEEMAIKTAERKGKEEGLKEGQLKEKLMIARNSLKQGIDVKTISLITGLSIEEINKLAASPIKES